MIKNITAITVTCFALFFCFSIISCGDEETIIEPEVSLLPYNADEHIYATFGNFNGGKWEVVLNPSTGKFTKILETESIFGGFSNRIGAKELTFFSNNERLYFPSSSNSILEIQNLESFDTRQIEIIDTTLAQNIIFPQVINFGADNRELFILDTDKSLWKTNLLTTEVEKINNGIPVGNDDYITNIFQMPESEHFIGFFNKLAFNDYSASSIFIYDATAPDSTAILNIASIENSFGFIQHPERKNEIYYIRLANGITGFRLMKMRIEEDIIFQSQISETDIPIDQLSFYLQTIHTASNSYVIRGGSSTEGSISNFIYSIDLTTGSLVHEFKIEEEGYFLKMAGE